MLAQSNGPQKSQSSRPYFNSDRKLSSTLAVKDLPDITVNFELFVLVANSNEPTIQRLTVPLSCRPVLSFLHHQQVALRLDLWESFRLGNGFRLVVALIRLICSCQPG